MPKKLKETERVFYNPPFPMLQMSIPQRQMIRSLMIALSLSAVVVADEQNINPDINKRYKDPEYSIWVERFERPGRDVFDHRFEIVTATNVQSGMVVADIGAGTGLFTRLFSPAVGPAGKVYAVDIAENFVTEIIRRARTQGLDNVEGIVNTQKDAGLSPGSIDLAFVCATYHHFEYPRTMLQSIHRALRPDGELVVIDYRKIESTSTKWVLGHMRAKKASVIKEIESEGFKLIDERDFLRVNYFLRFSKKALGL